MFLLVTIKENLENKFSEQTIKVLYKFTIDFLCHQINSKYKRYKPYLPLVNCDKLGSKT